MSRLFDAYIIVDRSVAAKPATGANSIWVGIRARDARLKFQFTSVNPKTRLAAREFIADMADKLISRGDRILIGVDFSLGYPAGTAQRAGLIKGDEAPWQAIHTHLTSKFKPKDDNSESKARFAVAASLNYAISKGPHPFWGVPKRDAVSTIATGKGDFSTEGSIAEHRMAEQWVKANFPGNPKSVWQLIGAGSVGSQALVGIPMVSYLRERFPACRVWPFETGFQEFTSEQLDDTKIVIAEVYPSTLKTTTQTGEVIDLAQIRTLSEHLESLDSAGKLAAAFGPPKGFEDGRIATIEAEEGWILAK